MGILFKLRKCGYCDTKHCRENFEVRVLLPTRVPLSDQVQPVPQLNDWTLHKRRCQFIAQSLITIGQDALKGPMASLLGDAFDGSTALIGSEVLATISSTRTDSSR